MKTQNGVKAFGFFEGLPYGAVYCTEKFEAYRAFHNSLSRENVAAYIEKLPVAYASIETNDIFTGASLGNGGLYNDGAYTFPVDFLHYYKNYDIGIPPEYEQYLKSKDEFNG